MKKNLTRLIFGILIAMQAFGQTKGQPVSVVAYPGDTPTIFMDYAGGANLTYLCVANPINNGPSANFNYSLSVTGATLTSIVVLTNVGTATTVADHGLMASQTVVVSGSTTAALNGTYVVATVPTTKTFTITTSGVANATYNNGALTIAGSVPLLTSPIWSIRHFLYDGSNNLTGTQCANGTCAAQTNICSNRATVVYK